MRLAPILQPLTEPLLSPLVTAITGASGGGFSPISLFSGTDKGYIFDNNDLTSFYLDSAGTTPALVNGLVGLQLDKSGNLALGTELRASGAIGLVGTATAATYNTGTGAGSVSRVDASNQSYVIFLGLSDTTMYRVTIQNTGATIVNVRSGSQAGAVVYTLAASETATVFLFPVSGAITITSGAVATTTFTLSSIRALPGNHRYQTTTGSKPILRGTPVGGNIVTNGDFAGGTTTGWTGSANGSLSVVSGRMRITNIAANGGAIQGITTVIGGVYRITIDFTKSTINGWISVSNNSNGSASFASMLMSATGNFTLYFTATATTTYIVPYVAAGVASDYIDVDNIIVQDASASAVTAPYGLQYDGVDDFLTTASVNFETATSDGLARRNLLTFPSAFDNAAWGKTEATITANTATAPVGGTLADKFIPSTNAASHYLAYTGVAVGGNNTFSVYAKADGYNYLVLLSPTGNVSFDLSAGVVASAGVASIQSAGGGWYRCSMTVSLTAGAVVYISGGSSSSASFFATAGDGTSGILIWGAQLEAGSTASTFQDIGTDKMAVVMGVRKLSDAAQGIAVELSADTGSNNGSFRFTFPGGAGAATYAWLCKGTVASSLTASGYIAPITNVVSGIADIAGDSCLLRVNGVQVNQSTSDQGTGNYGNYALFFGRRGGSSSPYNGLDFGGVCVGKTLTATQLANIERWVNQRTGAY